MLSESRLLLKLWLKNPRKIGAVAASGPELAAAMARHIPQGADGYVVELGGGTGPVTRAILDTGVPPDRLIVVERDPNVRVVQGDAMHLQQLLRDENIHPVKAIVSSLPLLIMKKAIQYRIGTQ